METITSRQNPLMTHIRKLAGSAAYRRQTGQCLCDSPKLLREAAQWGAEVQTVVSVEPWPEPLPEKVRQVLVPPEVITKAILKAAKFGAAAPAIPVKDTIKVSKTGAVDETPDPPGGAVHLPRAGSAGAGNASGPALCGAGRGSGPRQRGNSAADPGRI